VVALKLSSPEIQKNSVKPIFRPEIHTALIRQKVRPEFGAGQLSLLPPGPMSFSYARARVRKIGQQEKHPTQQAASVHV